MRWVPPGCQAELVLPATRFASVPACLALQACAQHNLDGIVVIGGDDSNTNAAVIAEHFLAHVSSTFAVVTARHLLVGNGKVDAMSQGGFNCCVLGGSRDGGQMVVSLQLQCLQGIKTRVVGVPKTIDGELSGSWLDLRQGSWISSDWRAASLCSACSCFIVAHCPAIQSSTGDLKNADVPISFGFDTACKVFSESIGNIAIDAMSAKKYYHFIK